MNYCFTKKIPLDYEQALVRVQEELNHEDRTESRTGSHWPAGRRQAAERD